MYVEDLPQPWILKQNKTKALWKYYVCMKNLCLLGETVESYTPKY